MFPAEYKKHFGKFQIIVLLVLFLGNILIPIITYREYFSEKYAEIQSQKSELLELALNHPEQYETILANHTANKKQYDHEKTISIMLYDGRTEVNFPNQYLFYPDYGDIQLFNDVEEILHAPNSYRTAISNVMRDTALRLKSNQDADTYMHRYYAQLIRIYDPFFESSLPVSMIEGWNEFFSLKTPLVFTLLASLVMFAGVFPLEHKTGMHNLLAVSKHGRRKLSLVKMCTVMAGSTCLTVVFTLSPLLTFMASSGLSDTTVPVQLLEGFTYCWLDWNIGEYLFFLTAFRILFFCTFCIALTVIGQYLRSELSSVLFTAVGMFSGIVMERILPDSPVYFLQKFSPTLLADGQILFTKYYGVNLFSRCVGYTAFTVLGSVLLLLALLCVSLLQKYPLPMQKNREKKKGSAGGYFVSLYPTELYKMMICRKGLIFLLTALALRGIWSWTYFTPDTSMTEIFYKNYMTTLEGEITDEKISWIAAEGEEMQNLLDSYAEMNSKRNNNLISEEEYKAYESQYTTATYSEEAYKELCKRRDYLIRANENYDNIKFLYDEGITRYLNRPYDVISILVILFFSYTLFPAENDAKIAPIIECTKYGRRKLTGTKFLCIMSVAAVLMLCTATIDIYSMKSNYGFIDMTASIQSIPLFESVKTELSIKQYLILYQCTAILGYIVCWITSVFVSAYAKTSRKSLTVLTLTLFLPYLTSVFGTEVFSWINYERITSPVIVSSSIPTLICMAVIGTYFVIKNKYYFSK